MMQLAADLHIHSCFSMASSPRMLPSEIIAGCWIKGISVIGTGDILHPEWRAMWEDCTIPDDIVVIPTTEVESERRVHHLILLPDFDAARELADRFSGSSRNISTNGRPRVNLSGGEILRAVHETGGLGGPAHAFTPYTSVYASHDSLSSCYGNEPVDLLELGLSADSSYGAGIRELEGIPFLTNSDAHSPDPAKLGREFTILDVEAKTPASVLQAVRDGSVVMNAGFFPEEGKYNRTGCSRCFREFSAEEAGQLRWKCPDDNGRIKLGVSDRAGMLSSGSSTPRPPYLHLIPLIEIIQRLIGASGPNTRRCRDLYDACITRFGDEITALTRSPPAEIAAIHPGLSAAVTAFREGRIILHPGCGGRYGSFEIPGI